MHVNRYEKAWIWLGAGTMIVFFCVVAFLGIAIGMNPPSHEQTIDPTKVSSTPPFDHPGLHKLPDGSYEAYYVGAVFAWYPTRLVVPRGAKVTFYATSVDVMHGFLIAQTDVNMEIVPGWVSTMSHTFQQPGDYLIVCNQYCGAGHQAMGAHIVVQ
jgi:cytochrome c oxidase subunit 2